MLANGGLLADKQGEAASLCEHRCGDCGRPPRCRRGFRCVDGARAARRRLFAEQICCRAACEAVSLAYEALVSMPHLHSCSSQQRGLPAIVYRLGNQGASTGAAFWNDQDFTFLLLSEFFTFVDWRVQVERASQQYQNNHAPVLTICVCKTMRLKKQTTIEIDRIEYSAMRRLQIKKSDA